MLRTLGQYLLLPLLCIGLSMLAATAATQTVTVTATGMADGSAPDARSSAFTDAMREAVRQGAGVDIVSESRVSDFQLQADKILSSAFGYVRNYRVTRSALDADGIYRVTISAEVGRGAPERKDTMALQHIVRSRGAPRVAIDITELHEGVSGTPAFAASSIAELSRQSQMNVVNTAFASRQNQRLAALDGLSGREDEQTRREALLGLDADIIILGEVRSRYLGKQNVDNLYTVNRYSVVAELTAVRPDTGEVIAQVSLPGREDIFSRIANPENAARDIVGKYLAGERTSDISARTLIDRIISQWIIENDLGQLRRVEITGIDSNTLNTLQDKLRAAETVNGVWLRQFDAAGFTILDIETRLDASALAGLISRLCDGDCTLSAASGNFLQFRYVPAPVSGHQSAATDDALANTTADTAFVPLTASVLGGIAILAAVILIVRKRRRD